MWHLSVTKSAYSRLKQQFSLFSNCLIIFMSARTFVHNSKCKEALFLQEFRVFGGKKGHGETRNILLKKNTRVKG